MNCMTTGQLAQQAGVNVETVRFYERKGLLPKPPRRVSGYRENPADSVRLIRFIKRAKELGFTLREIRELLALRIYGARLVSRYGNGLSGRSSTFSRNWLTCAPSKRL